MSVTSQRPLVFISYDHADAVVMRRARDYLGGAGLQVWTDEDLVPGADWEKRIEATIENVDAVIVILTPNSKESEWVGNERRYAKTHGTPIYPVLAEGNEEQSVPAALTGIQWLDIRDQSRFESELKRLVRAISNHQKIKHNAIASDSRRSKTRTLFRNRTVSPVLVASGISIALLMAALCIGIATAIRPNLNASPVATNVQLATSARIATADIFNQYSEEQLTLSSPTYVSTDLPTATSVPLFTSTSSDGSEINLTPTETPSMPTNSVRVSQGDETWEVQVDKISMLQELSAFGRTYKAKGRYALLFMTVTNRGHAPQTFVAYGTLDILDADYQRYEEDIASSIAQFAYNTDIGADINPDKSAYVVAAYDISVQSEYYLLVPGSLADDASWSIKLDIP